MAELQVTLDYPLNTLAEPGFYRRYSSREITEASSDPTGDTAKYLWRDENTKTWMLKPRQFDPNWLDTENQMDSIIRLSDMVVNASDLSAGRIYEKPVATTTSPYIYHDPITPVGFTPSAPGDPPAPGSSVLGVATGYNVSEIHLLTRVTPQIYDPPDTVPAVPSPTVIGDYETDSKCIFHTKEKLDANQALYIRWYHPDPRHGFSLQYQFFIGQFCLKMDNYEVEVYQDVSAGGDRTSWSLVGVMPLFLNTPFSPQSWKTSWGYPGGARGTQGDRWFLWLPYRRKQVLMMGGQGTQSDSRVLVVRPTEVMQASGVDWDITRSDTFTVCASSPASGRIQIQKVKYHTAAFTTNLPKFTLDYVPGVDPTVALYKDSFHGTTLTLARVAGNAYEFPENPNVTRCASPVTGTNNRSRIYGVQATFQSSPDGRWTPFFYGYDVAASRTFTTWPVASALVNDTSSANTTYIRRVEITHGEEPGDGRATIELVDQHPYAFSNYNYRGTIPIQIRSWGLPIFTGYADPPEIRPHIGMTDGPRFITIKAVDRWKQLEQSFPHTRDWQGIPHITVVDTIAQLAGVDTSTPAATYPPLTPAYNTALGGPATSVIALSRDTKSGWQPEPGESAAKFIRRVAENYANYRVGFYPDGSFYYLPSEFFTTPVAFFTASGGVYNYRNATFTALEPVANVVVVSTHDDTGSEIRASGAFVDWQSILNPNAVNFLGYRRMAYVFVNGSHTCAQLNFIAATLFNRARRKKIRVEFEADYYPTLNVGNVITLEGYGDYRLTGIRAEFIKDTWMPARYIGEFLSSGV